MCVYICGSECVELRLLPSNKSKNNNGTFSDQAEEINTEKRVKFGVKCIFLRLSVSPVGLFKLSEKYIAHGHWVMDFNPL